MQVVITTLSACCADYASGFLRICAANTTVSRHHNEILEERPEPNHKTKKYSRIKIVFFFREESDWQIYQGHYYPNAPS